MFRFSKDGVSAFTVLDTRRVKRNGLYPVKIEMTYKRRQKYFRTGKDLSIAQWEKLPSSRAEFLTAVRADLESSFSKIKERIRELTSNGEFCFNTLSSCIEKGSIYTLNSLFNEKIEALSRNNQINTLMLYGSSLRSIEEFAGKEIRISLISPEWLQRYENFLIARGNSYTSAGIYIKNLRCIMNIAKSREIIKPEKNPFGSGKYDIPSGSARKLALSLKEIKAIVTYTDNKRCTEELRDLWFFSYMCNGINFADMLMLKYSNIFNGEIRFHRAKTLRTTKCKKEIRALITPEMQSIIEGWGNPNLSGNFIFKYLKGGETPLKQNLIIKNVIKRCNNKLRQIAKKLKIERLSTYSARHSFATVLKRSGANIAYISDSLGHTSLSTTETYLAGFEKEELIKNSKRLTDFKNL